MFFIDSKINYRNFGFIPKGKFLPDLYGKLFGHPNLMKRLQAKTIINAMQIKPADIIVDVGCGLGYFSIEFAKVSDKVYGVDISKDVLNIRVPEVLSNKLSYLVVNSTVLPFKTASVDIVFASEVISTVQNPNLFIKEWKRVLKPGGKLVLTNSMGRPLLRDFYTKKPISYKIIRFLYSKKMPQNYSDYEKTLNLRFGNAISKFIPNKEICYLLEENEFSNIKTEYTNGLLIGNFFTWLQYLYFINFNKVITSQYFLPYYLIFSVISFLDSRKSKGNVLYVAQNS